MRDGWQNERVWEKEEQNTKKTSKGTSVAVALLRTLHYFMKRIMKDSDMRDGWKKEKRER